MSDSIVLRDFRDEEEEERRRRRVAGVVILCCCLCIGLIILLILLITTGSTSVPPPTCCPRDPLVIRSNETPEYFTTGETLCGGHDFNCDGIEDSFACCGEPEIVEGESRPLWPAEQCYGPIGSTSETWCGGCVDASQNLTFYGWDCDEDGPEVGAVAPTSRKRFEPLCPSVCDETGRFTVIDAAPPLGECANVVVGCLNEANGDDKECCVHVQH